MIDIFEFIVIIILGIMNVAVFLFFAIFYIGAFLYEKP